MPVSMWDHENQPDSVDTDYCVCTIDEDLQNVISPECHVHSHLLESEHLLWPTELASLLSTLEKTSWSVNYPLTTGEQITLLPSQLDYNLIAGMETPV